MVETHLLFSRRDETPTFEHVFLTTQASIQMRVVFETIECALAKTLCFPISFSLLWRVTLEACFTGVVYIVENETPKPHMSASVGLRRRGVS